tara:strand:- start:110 stop:1081 length:972 start_codon:yes stop_codon:yes gene_type:complete
MEAPTLRDVYQAKKTIAPHIARTPLHYSAGLSELLSAEVYLKHEEYLPLGAFKQRGGVNLLANLTEEERAAGLITASTGNHGQSVASACRMFGVRAMVCLPENANPNKVKAMETLGAELIFHGENFDAARMHGLQLSREEGYRFVHPVNEPLLIAGVATASLETIEDLPDVQVLVVPLGGGSGVSGACIVAKSIDPSMEVLAVQSEQSPAGYRSWKEGKIVEAQNETFAEGVATGTGYELAQQIIGDLLDDFLLVNDDDIRRAVATLIDKAHTLAEGAGATALAGALKYPEKVKGKKVAITVSGSNTTIEQLRRALDAYQTRS